MSSVVSSAMNTLTMSEISVQMIFSPQNCTLDLLDKTLTPDRRSLADSILARIEDGLKVKAASYHLIIGPRGSGKTHVLAFIRKKLEASTPLQVIRLSEEERGITNLLDFLLACFRAAGIPGETAVDRIRHGNQATYKNAGIDYFKDAAIDYFCEITNGKSVLVIIENLSNLFDGLEESAISDLRGFFQEHPFISVIASSINLFTDSSKADHPFHGFFNIHPLEQLSRNDARKYLLALAQAKGDEKLIAVFQKNRPLARARVNAIYDLTAGNHRLLAMLNIFLTADGLDELVDPFIQMADRELTPYYQQRIDQLSSQQNKLLQTIANHHGRALNVNEIAHLTFLPSTTVSRQLYDLLHGGYVIRKQVGRESCYELSEPLLRLVLDLKEGRDRPLPIIVNLLKHWYTAKELQQLERTAPEHARCYYQAALGEMPYSRAGDFGVSLALQIQPDYPDALAGTIKALIHLNQADNALQSLSDMLKKVPASHDIRKTLASDLINLLLHDELHLKQVIEIYQDDQNSLMAGLTLWIQNQLPLSKSDAEKLEPAYHTLSSAFGAIPEAAQALQMFQAARLDAMGDPKALLRLPIELRRLIERVKEESEGEPSPQE
ncbi:MAG: hypothetical protein AB1611_07655 [bacterium]